MTCALLLAALVSSSLDRGNSAFEISADGDIVRIEAMSSAERLEFYLIPDGGTFDYYVFGVSEDGAKESHFYSESGNIEPDPYAPAWKATVSKVSGDKWKTELSIPLTCFYMTRRSAWKREWKVNVAAYAKGKVSMWAGKSKPERNEGFLKTFLTVNGFPTLSDADDVCIHSAVAIVSGTSNGLPTGKLRISVYTGADSRFQLLTSCSEPKDVMIPLGGGRLETEAVFPGAGRQVVRMALKRTDGKTFAREYPVYVDFRPLELRLTRPQYRGNFYPGQNSDSVEGRVGTLLGEPVEVKIEGPGFKTQKVTAGLDGAFRFDTKGFAEGDATLTVTSGKETLIKKIRKLPPLPDGGHMTWIENGNLVYDGKPVFRRGIYSVGFMGGKAFDEKYAADNLHLTKGIDEIASFDLRWISPDLKKTEAKRDQKPSPEVFAHIDKVIAKGIKGKSGAYYYISDEPECHGTSAVYLKYIYDYVAEKDPYHVIASCCRAGERYGDIADWFETHPYINPQNTADGRRIYSRNFNELGRYVDAFHPDEHPERCIGGTPTCFAYSQGDYPTFEEYMLNFWCEIVRGAKTMFAYAYHDLGDRPSLYEGTRYMFESLEALEDIILRGKRKTLVKTGECECALWTRPEGDRMFVAVNFTQEAQKIVVKGLSGNYREFRGARRFSVRSGTDITLELKPLESLICCEKDWDAGLKSVDDVSKSIADAEYARTHRDNQLAGRHKDMDIVTSFGRRGAWRDDAIKVFDGTLDVIAWRDEWHKDKFFEMAFTKFVPNFNEVSVYGRNIDGYSVKIRKNGEWVELVPTSVEKEGDRITLKFGKMLSTVKIRLGFPGNHVEVYEIELPGKAHVISKRKERVAHDGVFWTMRPQVVTNACDWPVEQPTEPSYLVFSLDKCPPIKDNGYLNWQMYDVNSMRTLCGSVSFMIPGHYTLRYPASSKGPDGRIRIYDWNFKMDFGEVVCCKRPADCVDFVEKEGEYLVTVRLSAPCEDMTCSFFYDGMFGATPYVVRDGRNSIDLKPVDVSRRLWTGRARVPEWKNPKKLPFPFVKVTVLGGEMSEPLLAWLAR